MADNAEGFREQIDSAQDLRGQIENIRSEISALREIVFQLVTDIARIKATLATGEDDSRGVLQGPIAAGSLESQIARNPLTAVLVALSLGVTVGLFHSIVVSVAGPIGALYLARRATRLSPADALRRN